MREDIRTVLSGDPAARNWLEVVLFYPGLHALWSHRVAHLLWRRRLRLFARFVSYLSRFLTGIEIHPAAGIGRRFFIDHGAGVVIGETAEIGNDVLIYQGVVLGGTTLEKKKRHPTICDKVVIGASAIVLGPIVVGEGARIGANSVVVRPVPAGAVVVGVPGRIVEDRKEPVLDLQHGKLPDPFSEAIRLILEEQLRLSRRIAKLEEARGLTPVPDDIAEKLKWIEKAFNNISNSDGSDK
ncbi:MAG: serine O-acetyltransferase [Dehalococcoidia bacterium]|nr:serine O-acetyltransferase [Dehalococcoidia bacterium]